MSEIFENRIYNDEPYLIFPGALPFKIKLGSLSPSFRVSVYQRDNLFGDATPLALAGYEITLLLYNNTGNLIASGSATIIDALTAEVEYNWGKFDIKESGVYYVELLFKDIDDKTFVLPSRDRIQIVVF